MVALKSNAKHRQQKVLFTAIFLILVVALFIYVLKARSHPSLSKSDINAKTTSTRSTAQNNYTSGDARTPSSNNGNNNGGAIDTKGAAVNESSGQSTTSASGNITLLQPYANQSISSGNTLAGTAKVDQVGFRVIDDEYGVIAQGSLSVVDGKFSGKLQFTAHSSSGEVDIFSIDPVSGAETNSIKINITFD